MNLRRCALTLALLAPSTFAAPPTGPAPAITSTAPAASSGFPQIIIDQFGYAPGADPVALFADPVKGQNATRHYTPGQTFEIRDAKTNALVHSGPLTPWKNGTVQPTSGDKVWQADLSKLTTPGEYYLFDPATGERSYRFRVAPDVYAPVLRAAVRMYYYQRCGVALTMPYAKKDIWTHPPCHPGDRAAVQYPASVPTPPVELSGGWHDAGDYTKYVPFTLGPIAHLLWAHEFNPAAFADDGNIPESGNGVPDVLDEVKFELDWLLKCQLPDGSVINRVGNEGFAKGGGPPNVDDTPRRRTAPTTWATATFAADLALAAHTFQRFEKQYPGYATRLRDAALKAWAYLEKTPAMTPAEGEDGAQGKVTSASAGSTTVDDRRLRAYAAANLFLATGDTQFRDAFDTRFTDGSLFPPGQKLNPYDPTFPFEFKFAFLAYTRAKGGKPETITAIKTALAQSADAVLGYFDKDEDAYRAFMWDGHYCWGSSQMKAAWANVLLFAVHLGAEPDNDARYRRAAAGYLHYLHGRNPLNLCYLTNMTALGASRCAMRPYHTWYNESPNHPAVVPPLAYLVGGPNTQYDKKFNAPPFGEPPMKAYLDFQRGWSDQHHTTEDSWAITEPAIYYQAAYIFLASEFARK